MTAIPNLVGYKVTEASGRGFEELSEAERPILSVGSHMLRAAVPDSI